MILKYKCQLIAKMLFQFTLMAVFILNTTYTVINYNTVGDLNSCKDGECITFNPVFNRVILGFTLTFSLIQLILGTIWFLCGLKTRMGRLNTENFEFRKYHCLCNFVTNMCNCLTSMILLILVYMGILIAPIYTTNIELKNSNNTINCYVTNELTGYANLRLLCDNEYTTVLTFDYKSNPCIFNETVTINKQTYNAYFNIIQLCKGVSLYWSYCISALIAFLTQFGDLIFPISWIFNFIQV